MPATVMRTPKVVTDPAASRGKDPPATTMVAAVAAVGNRTHAGA